MELDLSLINILILFGAVQGFIFCILLFFAKRHPGSFYLGLVMVAMVYNGLETFNWSAGLENHFTFFDFYPFVTIFLIGPGFYLYCKSLLCPAYSVPKRLILSCFLPFFVQVFIVSLGWSAAFLTRQGILDLKSWGPVISGFYLGYSELWSLMVYLFFVGLIVWEYKKAGLAGLSSDKRQIQKQTEARVWLRNLLIFQVLLGVLWTATLLVPYLVEWPFEWSYYFPVEIFLVIFLYWIAIVGYSKLKTIRYPEIHGKTAPGISQTGESEETLRLITQAMEADQLYLNPELSLAILASHTGLAPKMISLTLNQQAGTNFNDFVNAFRVEAFCREIQNEDNNNLTLAGVASRCGFNSPATFQRTFKKMKGVTPKTYANGLKLVQNP